MDNGFKTTTNPCPVAKFTIAECGKKEKMCVLNKAKNPSVILLLFV